jgi:hypothetical protein
MGKSQKTSPLAAGFFTWFVAASSASFVTLLCLSRIAKLPDLAHTERGATSQEQKDINQS